MQANCGLSPEKISYTPTLFGRFLLRIVRRRGPVPQLPNGVVLPRGIANQEGQRVIQGT
jgi:hypothetical protein